MAKLTVAPQRIFASSVSPTGLVAQVGSTVTGTPNYTNDPVAIQALAAFLTGYSGQLVPVTGGRSAPVLQEENALRFLLTRQIAYLLQAGTAEWNEITEYCTESLIQVSGRIYRSLQNGNVNHLVTDGAWWAPYSTDAAGTVKIWAPVGVPSGWLTCDGTVYNISAYPTLGAALGNTYGGNGTTTFGVPDLRGRVPVGLGTGDATGASDWTVGRKAGAETHQLATGELATHSHGMYRPQGSEADNGDVGNYLITANSQPTGAYPTAAATNDEGGNTPHNNVQPSLGVRYLIKT